MRSLLLLGSLLVCSACQGNPPTAADQTQLDQARARLADDADAALAIADQLLQAHPDWRAAHLLRAQGSLQMAQDPARQNRGLLLQDAIAGFERAAELDDQDADCLLQLAEARLLAGEAAGAETAAQRAAALCAGQPGRQAEAARAGLLAARAIVQQFVGVRRQERDSGTPRENGIVPPASATAALAGRATEALKQPLVLATAPAESYRLAAQVQLWLDQPDQALLELENGIRRCPDDSGLHLDLQRLYQQIDQLKAMCGAYSRMLKEQPGTPILLWYQGRAEVMLADELRQKGSWQGAVDTYQKARARFAQYGAMQPAHGDATAEWLAILDLAIARSLVDLGDLQGAQQHLFAADAIGAGRLVGTDGQKPLVDSFGCSYANVAFAIGRALAETGDDRLRATLDFYTALLARHPETWGWAYNNAGLAARDLGVQLEQAAAAQDAATRQRAHEQAMALWQQSYRHYETASRLSPDDPRIVNDCGLMLLYHLRTDLDRARELFLRAIAVGQPQLDQLPADAAEADRNFLEEAVGDAWQNLAVLASELQRPFAEYRPYCEKALQYYPKRQRAEVLKLLADGEKAEAAAASGRERGGPRAGLPPQSPSAQGGQDEEFRKLQAAAAAKAKDGDFDAALAELDKGVKSLQQHAPFRALRGQYALALAKAARDGGRKGVEFLFADAVAELQRAVELDGEPAAPRLLLAEAQYEGGDAAAAATTSSRLLLHLQSQGSTDAAQLDAAHALRAAAAARVFAAAGGVGKDEQLQQARLSYKHLEQRGRLDFAQLQLWSTMEQWANKPAEAVNVFARALAKAPDDPALLSGLCDTARATGELEPAIAALQPRTDALGLWYLGCCYFRQGAARRAAADNAEALKDLGRAIACFDKSMAQNRDYAASCQQWLAWCYGKKGCIAFHGDDVANAEQWLLRSAQLKPEEIATDLGTKDSTKYGILLLAEKFRKANDLGRVEAIYRAAAAAASADGDLLNNAGLFARDWGNVLERQGKTAEAREMYEQSYKAYSQAQRLDPQNVRLCNDAALILVYHLERDWERSRQLLEQGIAVGEQQLREAPPQDRQEFQDFDEALGDCYENLALWHLKHGGDLAAARAAAERSQQHHPGQGRPGARRHLAEIQRREQGK